MIPVGSWYAAGEVWPTLTDVRERDTERDLAPVNPDPGRSALDFLFWSKFESKTVRRWDLNREKKQHLDLNLIW